MATEKKDKIARCEINESGRILNANRKFCKMFGFEADEPMWHYICDLYRYQKDCRDAEDAIRVALLNHPLGERNPLGGEIILDGIHGA